MFVRFDGFPDFPYIFPWAACRLSLFQSRVHGRTVASEHYHKRLALDWQSSTPSLAAESQLGAPLKQSVGKSQNHKTLMAKMLMCLNYIAFGRLYEGAKYFSGVRNQSADMFRDF